MAVTTRLAHVFPFYGAFENNSAIVNHDLDVLPGYGQCHLKGEHGFAR